MSHTRPATLGVLADPLASSRVREALLVLGYALLVGLSAQIAIPLPGTPVPITGQTFAVLLGAAALGSARGALGMGVYLTAGVLGVPWFAPTSGATFGYLIGFIAAAALVGALAERGFDRRFLTAPLAMVLGNLTIYLFGVPYLMAATGMDLKAGIAAGATPFLIGDALKIVAAAALLPGTWWLVRRFRGEAPTQDG